MSSLKTPTPTSTAPPAWHTKFLELLPAIQRYAKYVCRRYRAEARQEVVQELTAHCCCAVARLAERDKLDAAHPTVLVDFALRQFRDGRRVGTRANARDVTSAKAQRRDGFEVEPMETWSFEDEEWWNIQLVDRKAQPADLAAFRVDFAAWLRVLPSRARKIVLALARGDRATEIARRHRVSDARISQLRSWLRRRWEEFHAEDDAVPSDRVAACA